MKDAECAVTNEKSNLQFLWSFLYSKLVNFSMNFEYKIDHSSKNKKSENYFFIRFSSLRIFSFNLTTFEPGDTIENHTVSPVNCKYNQLYL